MKIFIIPVIAQFILSVSAMEIYREPLQNIVDYGTENWQQVIKLNQDIQVLQSDYEVLANQEKIYLSYFETGEQTIQLYHEIANILNFVTSQATAYNNAEVYQLYKNKLCQLEQMRETLNVKYGILSYMQMTNVSNAAEINPDLIIQKINSEKDNLFLINLLNTSQTRNLLTTIQKSGQQLWQHLREQHHNFGILKTLQEFKQNQIQQKWRQLQYATHTMSQTCLQFNRCIGS